MKYLLLLLMIGTANAAVPTESSAEFDMGIARDYISEEMDRENMYKFGADITYLVPLGADNSFVFEAQTDFTMHGDRERDPVSADMYKFGVMFRSGNVMVGAQHMTNGERGEHIQYDHVGPEEDEVHIMEIEDNRDISKFINSAVIRYYLPHIMVELAVPFGQDENYRDLDDITAYHGVAVDADFELASWLGVMGNARTGTKDPGKNVTGFVGVWVALNPTLRLEGGYTKGYSSTMGNYWVKQEEATVRLVASIN